MRLVGGLIGAAIAGGVIKCRYESGLLTSLGQTEHQNWIKPLADPRILMSPFTTLPPEVLAVARVQLLHAVGTVLYLCACASLLGLFIMWRLPRFELRKS